VEKLSSPVPRWQTTSSSSSQGLVEECQGVPHLHEDSQGTQISTRICHRRRKSISHRQDLDSLYPIPIKITIKPLAFVDLHPLAMVAQYKDNLNAMKVVWEHLNNTCITDEHEQIPTNPMNWDVKKSAAQIARKATRFCVKSIFESGSVEMLEYLLSTTSDAKIFVQQYGIDLFGHPNYRSFSHYTPRFFQVLKTIGVMPSVEGLCQSFEVASLAHYLLDEVDWTGREAQVLCGAFRIQNNVERSVAKRLIQAVPSDPFLSEWQSCATNYVRIPDPDLKVVKWLLKKSQATSLEPELALQCKDIEEGKPKLIRFLVEKNFFDLDKLDYYSGKTLLHFAVEKNQQEMVKALMDIGADPTIKGKRSAVSPMAIARQLGQGDCWRS